MKYGTALVAAFLLVGGCSHAKAKPTSQAGALAANRPVARPPLVVKRAPKTLSASPSRIAKRDDAIYFDFDSAVLKPEARPVLQEVGEELLHNQKRVRVEGNCDERGTTEYNIALGDRRAREAEQYLEHLGVAKDRISTMSYGSERPKALGHDEAAWAQNRRDDFDMK